MLSARAHENSGRLLSILIGSLAGECGFASRLDLLVSLPFRTENRCAVPLELLQTRYPESRQGQAPESAYLRPTHGRSCRRRASEQSAISSGRLDLG